MIFKKEDYDAQFIHFKGNDVDWFARDSNGNLGYFASAGGSPIPAKIIHLKAVLAKVRKFLLELNSLRSPGLYIHDTLQSYSGPDYLVHLREAFRNEMLAMGKKGVFCYDGDAGQGNSYVCLVAPTVPMTVDDLPDFARDYFEKVVLECDFATSRVL